MSEYDRYINLPGFDNVNRALTLFNVPVDLYRQGDASVDALANPDNLPTRERVERGIESLVGTAAYGLAPLFARLGGQKATQAISEMLMGFSGPQAAEEVVKDVVQDPSRRKFIGGVAATLPVAALAPDVITDVVTKAAKTGSRAPINPINMAMANIRALKGQIDEKYQILDEAAEIESPNADATRIRDDAEAFINRSENEIFDEVEAVLEGIDPSAFRTASNEALEEIASHRYDPQYGFSYYDIEKMDNLPNFKILIDEAKRRGLHTAKNAKGINEFPNLRTLVEDFTTDEAFRQAGFNVNPSMQMVRETPADIDADILELKLTELRRQIAQADRVMRVDGKTTKEIDDFKAQKRREMYELQGLPPDMDDFYANGGPVISGVGSLNQTARDMFRGPRGIESLSRFSDGGEATARDKVEIESLRNAVMMTESNGDPNAVSPKGAIGLMQIMPQTARNPGFGVENAFEIADKFGYVYNDMSDATLKRLLMVPEINVELGNQYLDAMLNQYTEVDDALRAYNAGKTNVDRFIASGRNLEVLTDEAVQYPIKVTAALQGYSPKDMNEMAMFEQSPETASALMSDYPAPPEENRMFTAPPIRPQLPPSFATEVRPPQRNFQPVIPGQQTNLFEQYGGIANLATSVRPRPRPSQLN